MKKINKIFLAIIILVMYSFGLYKFASNPTATISTKTNDPHLARFIENYNLLKNNWYYFKGEKEVIEAATKAMTSSNLDNDKYSEYIPADKSKEYFSSMDTDFIGLGVQYVNAGEYPLISRIFYNSPAAKAKMQVGDSIINVDGKSVKNVKSEDVKKRVQGKTGQVRKLTLRRNNKEFELKITLQPIESSVHYQVIDNKGYLMLEEFSKTSAAESKKPRTFQTS